MSSGSHATVVSREASDSNSRNEPTCGPRNSRRRRSDQEVHSARYKGVVVQQNGNWGAQIYYNNERIWLGTFKSEREAGTAYDSAALKLRNGDSDRNFPWTDLTMHEPQFQSRFSTEAVLNMIKDGSYPSRLENYVNTLGKTEEHFEVHPNVQPSSRKGGDRYIYKQLFQKELTPSDVGKLNRLVIPKKSALKFFPPIPEGEMGKGTEEVQLTFYDKSMKLWKFRYCYWKSSQSFVFTRGWNRFVSVNSLRAGDIVTFSMCEWRNDGNEASVLRMIEVSHRSGGEGCSGFVVDDNVDEMANEEDGNGDVDEEESDDGVVEEKTANLIDTLGLSSIDEDKNGNCPNEDKEGGSVGEKNEEKKGFMLFGVQIS